MKRCRHTKMWIIAGGYYSWCYSCGALQKNEVTPPNFCSPVTRWLKPVGDGENPLEFKPLKPRVKVD